MIKILIAIPTFENIFPETFKSVYDLKIPRNIKADFDYVRGYDCAVARNKIAELAIEKGYDYLLTIDSDIIVPKDTIIHFLEYDPIVVLGIYPRKNQPSKSEVFDVRYDSYSSASRWNISELSQIKADRIEIRGGGLGCSLIKTDILKEVGYPQFKYEIQDNGSLLSEDLYFCDKVRKLNYKIYVDTRVLCKHIGRKIITC